MGLGLDLSSRNARITTKRVDETWPESGSEVPFCFAGNEGIKVSGLRSMALLVLSGFVSTILGGGVFPGCRVWLRGAADPSVHPKLLEESEDNFHACSCTCGIG